MKLGRTQLLRFASGLHFGFLPSLPALTGAIAFVAAVSLSAAARADDTKINLSITGCEAAGVFADRLFALAQTELMPHRLAVADGSPRPGELQLVVQLCQGSPETALLALSRAGQQRVSRLVDLSDVVGELRTRTLAVLLAEFVNSPSSGLGLPSATAGGLAAAAAFDQISSSPPQISAQNVDVATTRSRQTTARATSPETQLTAHAAELGAGLMLREFFTPRTSLLGPWLSIAGNRWLGEVQLLTSSSDQPRGTVVIYDSNLAAAFALVTWGERAQLALRLRGELGWVWAKGIATSASMARGSTQSAPQSALLFEVLARGTINRRIGIETRLTLALQVA